MGLLIREMAVRYELRRPVLGSTGCIFLSADEYDSLVRSRLNLRFLLFIEEQFDLLLENYIELENDLLSIGLRRMVAAVPDYSSMQRERNLVVNRRVLNLLSSCRGYLDQTPHHLNTITVADGKLPSITSADFKRYTHEQYDEFLEYRVMEALRNYTQHAGFPLAAIYDFRWLEGTNAESQLRSAAQPYIDVPVLTRGFKAETRKELDAMGDKVRLMPMVRQYIASLGAIHEKLRKALRSDVEEWERTVRGAIERFKEAHPAEDTLGLHAIKVVEEGREPEEKIELYAKPIEYRQALEKRNRNLGSLARRYVSSESF